jgi:hypothetical protein
MNAKSLHDLEASLAVISSNVKAYQDGNIHAYRPVAVELRKLLCDTKGKNDNSLIKRLMPNFRLRPLSGDQNKIDKYTTLYIPGQMSFNGKGGSNLSKLFNESAPSLLLDEWLEQKLFDFTMTIKNFIRSVADKEGAHSDTSYNNVLGKTKSVFHANDALAGKAILAIGRYIVKALALQMVNDNITEIAKQIATEYNKVGRGMAILRLSEFAARFSKGIPLKYEAAITIESYFQQDASKLESIRQTIRAYEPSDFFLILITDLNGEIWAYQQAMKANKS